MQAQFWHERWKRREIGFHLPRPHVALERHWKSLALPQGARVFVPLAGKSLDLLWLADHGHAAVGIELSPLAVREFFEEHPGVSGVDLRCGDLFDLTPATLGPIDAIFDRASLVALPPAMRAEYAAHLTHLSPPDTQTLLVTMEYDQRQMRGPPHAVMPDEVRALFGAHHEITELDELTALEDFPRMSARGVMHLAERVYRLARR